MPADDPHEGCGIWPALITDTKFLPACAWHDVAYIRESFLQGKLTRKQVDRWFLDQMLRIATNWRERAQAYAFYALARVFGAPFWEGR